MYDYTGDYTIVIKGWSERSYMLLKLFILGLRSEPDRCAGLQLGELNAEFRVNKVICRLMEGGDRDTNGLWLFGRSDDEQALFFTPDLLLGRGAAGGTFAELLIRELGVCPAEVTRIARAVEGKICEVVFQFDGRQWHGSHKLLTAA